MTTSGETAPNPDELLRLPGLFRRWEIEQVVEAGSDFHLEEAGCASDGTPLFAVYQRISNQQLHKEEKRQ